MSQAVRPMMKTDKTSVTDSRNVASETIAAEYGRRCADAMNAHDVSLYNVLKQQFNHRKAAASLTAGTGNAADAMQSQFNASYRANRII
jgi:hypothetical protein